MSNYLGIVLLIDMRALDDLHGSPLRHILGIRIIIWFITAHQILMFLSQNLIAACVNHRFFMPWVIIF